MLQPSGVGIEWNERNTTYIFGFVRDIVRLYNILHYYALFQDPFEYLCLHFYIYSLKTINILFSLSKSKSSYDYTPYGFYSKIIEWKIIYEHPQHSRNAFDTWYDTCAYVNIAQSYGRTAYTAYARLRCLPTYLHNIIPRLIVTGKLYHVINVNSTSSLMCMRSGVFFYFAYTFGRERCSVTNILFVSW